MLRFLRTDVRLPKWMRLTLPLIPFVALVIFYFVAVDTRRANNPDDKVMPTVSEMVGKMGEMTLPLPVGEDEMDWETEVRLKSQYPFWKDLWASSRRFGVSLALIVLIGVPLGLYVGTFPLAQSFLQPFLTWFDKIPALALLPILFVIWGVLGWQVAGDSMKIALIVIGVLPTVALDTAIRAQQVPRELVYKAQSLAATEQEVAWRAIFPQIWPGVLETIRLNFKSMTLLLIAAEFVAASVGLAYRIFISRRNMEMDVIIPYVLVTMMLVFALDYGVKLFSKHRYRWYYSQ
jgi:NitT/TauT family transport system permease protein